MSLAIHVLEPADQLGPQPGAFGLVYPEATSVAGSLGIVTDEIMDVFGRPGLGIVTDDMVDVVGEASDVESTPSWKWIAALSSITGAATLAYHGYKRHGSAAAAIGWGVLGALFPVNFLAAGVAAAQGFGKRKR